MDVIEFSERNSEKEDVLVGLVETIYNQEKEKKILQDQRMGFTQESIWCISTTSEEADKGPQSLKNFHSDDL